MGLLGDIFGSSNSTSVNYLPEQISDIQNTNKLRGNMQTGAGDYMDQLKAMYGESLPGVMKQAQGGENYVNQVAGTVGETGESAARTGISGLESFFNPQYGQEQFQAAMAPIQAQYQQNMANQGAQFGGAGQLGSARQALAAGQLAGANQSAQMQAAANVMNNLNNQRLQAGGMLGNLGNTYLNTGMQAKSNALGYAQAPTDYLMNTLGKGSNYVNQSLYNSPYPTQQNTTQQSTPGIGSIIGSVLPFFL
jgi:hypothetical protein